MKLSEAIRKGAELKPQVFGHFYIEKGGKERTCALGAAYDATYNYPNNMKNISDGYLKLREAYPCLLQNLEIPGLTFSKYSVSLEQKIINMNDKMQMSREEIADKLEELGL